jgi:hypothetical protein
MVIVADVVAERLTKLLNISTSASRESWQFEIDTVLANTICILFKEFDDIAKLPKSEPDVVVIDAVDNAGIEFKD